MRGWLEKIKLTDAEVGGLNRSFGISTSMLQNMEKSSGDEILLDL
ncbi:hypothetical protein [Aquibacillus salsiterrae]|nr:hypothetical protein [Aquibacillus salsiterrae]